MRVIIAGSRNMSGEDLVSRAVMASKFEITQVVSGGAKGVDRLGEEYAERNQIDCVVFPAKWGEYGRSAGPKRNREMAKNADALIAIWDGFSRGTGNMIKEAEEKGLKIYVFKSDHHKIIKEEPK